MPRLVSIEEQSYAALSLQSIRATIGPLQVALRHRNLRNLTLQQECYLTNIPLDHWKFLLPTWYFRTAL